MDNHKRSDNRIKTSFPKPVLKSIYHSLITPYLYYGVLAWGFNNSRLLKLQKRAVRIITFSHFLEHTDPLFKQEKIQLKSNKTAYNSPYFPHGIEVFMLKVTFSEKGMKMTQHLKNLKYLISSIKSMKTELEKL